MNFIFGTVFSLIFNSITILFVNEILSNGGLSILFFGKESKYEKLSNNEKKRVLISVTQAISFTLLLFVPILKMLLVLFSYGLILTGIVYWIVGVMTSLDIANVVLSDKNLHISACFDETVSLNQFYGLVKPFMNRLKKSFWKKEIWINLSVILIIMNKDISNLNIVHCIVVYYICSVIASFDTFLLTIHTLYPNEKVGKKSLNIYSDYFKYISINIWRINYILQFLIIVNLILTRRADFLTYSYIIIIPLIWHNM